MPAINISSNSVPKTPLHAKVYISDMAESQVNNVVVVETVPNVNIVAPNVTDIVIFGNIHVACSNPAESANNINAAENQPQFDTKANSTQNTHTTHAAENLHSNKNIVDTSKSNYIIENQEYFNYDDPLLVDLLGKNWDLENKQTHKDKSVIEEIGALNDLFDRNRQER
ncbi:hypothetical protein Salat_2575700, partial [Sesamum alatum]